MFFRTEIADPAVLQNRADAFDVAWIAVNSERRIDPLASSAERGRLSYIIMHFWQADPTTELATVAAECFLGGNAAAASMTSVKNATDHAVRRAGRPSELRRLLSRCTGCGRRGLRQCQNLQ